MKKKWISFILAASMFITLIPGTAAAASQSGYPDIPADDWSVNVVNAAGNYGLMNILKAARGQENRR